MEEQDTLIEQHSDVATPHRFKNVTYRGSEWDLSHLDPFAFRAEIQTGLTVDVVVLFSCHCFTHGQDKDARPSIPAAEIYFDGTTRRVLNPERWQLSREKLPTLVQHLKETHIKVLGQPSENYATFSTTNRSGVEVIYAVFFDVKKDKVRKKRLLMRIQSAYILDSLTRRLQKARKVNLIVLLRAVYEGRPIRA